MKRKKMKITIIITVILLGLVLWVVLFDTPKMLLIYGVQLIVEKVERSKEHSKGMSERKELNKKTAKLNIDWTDNLDGDFSFKDKWQYDDATVFNLENKDSVFPTRERIDGDLSEFCKKWAAKEDELRKYIDSMEYINLTTQYPYTLKTIYEFKFERFGFMLAEQIDSRTVECQSNYILSGFVLNLNIVGNVCYPVIGFPEHDNGDFLQPLPFVIPESYTPSPFEKILPCKEGSITIDKTCWNEGWLKSSFSFVFDKSDSGTFTLSGKIFTPIRFKKVNGEIFMQYGDERYSYGLMLNHKY